MTAPRVVDRRKGHVAADEPLTLQQLAGQHCGYCHDTGQQGTRTKIECTYCTSAERRERNRARAVVTELAQRPVEPCECGVDPHPSWCPASVRPQFIAVSRPAPRYLEPTFRLTSQWFQRWFQVCQQAAAQPGSQVIINTEFVGNAHVGRDQFRRILLLLQVPFSVNRRGGIQLDNGSTVGYAAPEPFEEVLPC